MLNSLSGTTTQSEAYDASGNQTGDGTYGYDAGGDGRGVATSYALNGVGQRIQKTGSGVPNGGANEYMYDEAGHLLGEYSSIGTIIKETVWLPNTPVSSVSARPALWPRHAGAVLTSCTVVRLASRASTLADFRRPAPRRSQFVRLCTSRGAFAAAATKAAIVDSVSGSAP